MTREEVLKACGITAAHARHARVIWALHELGVTTEEIVRAYGVGNERRERAIARRLLRKRLSS